MDKIMKIFLTPEAYERFKQRRSQKALIKKIAGTEKEKAIDLIRQIMEKTDDSKIKAFAAKHIDMLEKEYYITQYKQKAEGERLREDKELLRKDIRKRDDKLTEIVEKMKEVFPGAVKDEKLAKGMSEVLKDFPAEKKLNLPNMVLRFRMTFIVIIVISVFLLISSLMESARMVKGIGQVMPKSIANIQAEIEGKIEDIYIDEGSVVEKGQIIGRFEKTQFLTQLGLEEIVGGEKEVGKAEASLRHAEEQYARYKSLYDKQSATKKQMEDAEFNLKYAQEEYKREMDNIKKCDVRAPISGVVLTSKMRQKVGSYLKRGEFICTIADLKSLNVEVPIKEQYINSIKIGQKAFVNFGAYPFRSFKGKVVAKEQIIFKGKTLEDIDTYQFIVTVQLDKSIEDLSIKLTTGMTASVKIKCR